MKKHINICMNLSEHIFVLATHTTCQLLIYLNYVWLSQSWKNLWGQHSSCPLSSPRSHFHVFQKLMVQQMGQDAQIPLGFMGVGFFGPICDLWGPKNPRSARLRDWRMVSKNPGVGFAWICYQDEDCDFYLQMSKKLLIAKGCARQLL